MTRVGVVGLRRGLVLARWCARLGMRVTALCDSDPRVLAQGTEEFPGAWTAKHWEDLLDAADGTAAGGGAAEEPADGAAGIDAVVLANDFDAHTEPSIAFLRRDVHVLSECAACTSEKEGRALVEAATASAASWSFAENYVTHPHVRLISRALTDGEVGTPELIECDYLHGMAPHQLTALAADPAHWRGRISPTAYCTHTLSPVLDVTDAWPVEVTAHPVQEEARPMAVVLVVRLSTGALAVTRQSFLQGEPDSHWSWLSVRGTRGLAESLRAPGRDAWSVRIRNEPWTHGGSLREEVLRPPSLRLGGGPVPAMEEGTALIVDAFRRTVTEGAPPRVPVRAAVAASLVGVAGARSLERGSVPVRLPDVTAW